jgi:hypothetical protein
MLGTGFLNALWGGRPDFLRGSGTEDDVVPNIALAWRLTFLGVEGEVGSLGLGMRAPFRPQVVLNKPDTRCPIVAGPVIMVSFGGPGGTGALSVGGCRMEDLEVR